MKIIDKLILARQRRFAAIARVETTPAGYVKYAPIRRGPWMNGLLVLCIVWVAPLYVLWRMLLRAMAKAPGR